MKTKMLSMTLAALLAAAGTTSAFAQDNYENSYSWIAQATSNGGSVGKRPAYNGAESASTGIGVNLDTYGKSAGAPGSGSSTHQNQMTYRHQGYAGPGSAATSIGSNLGSYGKTVS